MPGQGKHNGKGGQHGQGGEHGQGGGQQEPMEPQGGHGRSEQSPGHLKKAAGAQSARDFAPGHVRRDDESANPTETTGLGDLVEALRRG
ncbi:MAG TPA: hypothetical protein VM451_04720 [Candidatus Limnocylindria bacterium]|nr:hypothetical protein [Candidatus Limnocylindria bacterium]